MTDHDLIERLLYDARDLAHASMFLADEVGDFDEDLAAAIRGTALATKERIESAVSWVTDAPNGRPSHD